MITAADVHVATDAAARLGEEPTPACCSPSRSTVAGRPARLGLPRPGRPSPTWRRRPLPWPEPSTRGRPRSRQPAGRPRGAALGARPALPRPLPRAGDAGPRRPARPRAASTPAVRRAPLAALRSPGSSRRGLRRAARGRAAAPPASGRPSSPAGPAPARPPRSPGCSSPCTSRPRRAASRLRIAMAAPTGKAAARLRAGGRRDKAARLRRGRPGAAGRVSGDDPAPAAADPAGQPHPLPAPPRQPAAPRRRRRRRDVDGVADDDGPAARGGAARRPAGARRRPRPARPRSRRARCSPTSSAGSRAGADARSRRCARTHRFGDEIGALAEALRVGDADAAIEALRAGHEQVEWVDRPDPALGDPRHLAAARPSPYATRPPPATGPGRSRRSTGTGCCAPTATAPSACATGTGGSSSG